MNRIITILRDLTLFFLLILLVKVALDRNKTNPTRTGAVIYPAAQDDFENSDEYPETESQEPEPIQFSMPDLDLPDSDANTNAERISHETMVSSFATTDQQIRTLITLTPSTSKEFAQLQSMQQRLGQLKERYDRIVAASGGDNGIVIAQGMKQEQIENHLLRIVQLMGRILHVHNGSTENFQPYSSIENGLKENEDLLNKLQTPTEPVAPQEQSQEIDEPESTNPV